MGFRARLAFPPTYADARRLLTSTDDEIHAAAKLYRDRADAENNFDELRNPWGWGGFTTHDLKRCRLMAGMAALVYNWRNLFVRLANLYQYYEAITNRPLLLHRVATKTQHDGRTTLTNASQHAKQVTISSRADPSAAFLSSLQSTPEQLTDTDRLTLILRRAFAKFLRGRTSPVALLVA